MTINMYICVPTRECLYILIQNHKTFFINSLSCPTTAKNTSSSDFEAGFFFFFEADTSSSVALAYSSASLSSHQR